MISCLPWPGEFQPKLIQLEFSTTVVPPVAQMFGFYQSDHQSVIDENIGCHRMMMDSMRMDGCSLAYQELIMRERGYTLVQATYGNALFLRDDLLQLITSTSAQIITSSVLWYRMSVLEKFDDNALAKPESAHLQFDFGRDMNAVTEAYPSFLFRRFHALDKPWVLEEYAHDLRQHIQCFRSPDTPYKIFLVNER